MGQDRRRYARVGVALDFTVEVAGTQWRGKTLDLSPYGVKLALAANAVTLSPGTKVGLRLALPGGDSPLSLTARVVRADADGLALCFVNLGAFSFARLRTLVDSLLGSLSDGSARLEVTVKPLTDRRSAARAEAELDINFDAEMPHSWQGKTINLSTIGVKLALPATAERPPWGTSVQLRLVPPDGRPPISAKGIVWRREPDSTAVLFVELEREQLERLKALVDSLQGYQG